MQVEFGVLVDFLLKNKWIHTEVKSRDVLFSGQNTLIAVVYVACM